jgi:DNA-binding MarR family transcriptional regulator
MPGPSVIGRVERLNFLLPQIIRRMQQIPTDVRRAPAVSLPQLRMLLLLEMDGPSTMGDLARRASVAMPTATSSVNALVKARYVTRRRAKRDRRIVVVTLSAKGKDVLERLHEERAQRLQKVLERLDAADQTRFVEAFEVMLEVLRKLDEPAPETDAESQEALE